MNRSSPLSVNFTPHNFVLVSFCSNRQWISKLRSSSEPKTISLHLGAESIMLNSKHQLAISATVSNAFASTYLRFVPPFSYSSSSVRSSAYVTASTPLSPPAEESRLNKGSVTQFHA